MSEEKSQTKHPNTSAHRLAREAKALQIFLSEDFDTLKEMAAEMGYTDASTFRHTLLRALRKQLAEDAPEIKDKVAGRANAYIETLWPIAMGDLSIVPQWVGKGKDARRLECDEAPVGDEKDHKHFTQDGAQVCWVIPSEAKIAAINTSLKADKSLRDMYGTDFTHGLDERRLKLEEEKKHAVAEVIRGVLSEFGITLGTPEVNEAVKRRFGQLELVKGKGAG